MSKSIIVIETPKSCIECSLADCTGYCGILKDRQEGYALERHEKCPLKPIPDRKPFTGVDAIKAPFLGCRVKEALNEAACMGWNACIDAIGGNGSDRE